MKHLFATSILAAIVCLSIRPAAAATIDIQIAATPATLDPQKMSGESSDRVLGDFFEGLVTEDAAGNAIAGQAESWTVSADGLSYTFRLRDGLLWSDGEALTATDFVFAFRRLLDPKTTSDFAYIQYPIRNAEAINGGKSTEIDALGVAAPDERTLVFSLERPTPFFLEALIQPTAYPLPRHVVEKFGADWAKPEHIVGNGAYRLAEAAPDLVRGVRNDRYRDAGAVATDEIAYHMIDDEEAAFAAYESGTIDIATSYPRGKRNALNASRSGEARTTPSLGLWYLAVNGKAPGLDNPDVRRALSAAIDRQAIVAAAGGGELPAFGLVPPGVPGFETAYRPDWADMTLTARLDAARTALAKAGYGPGNPLRLILRTSTRDSQIRLGEALAATWKGIGVAVDFLRADLPDHRAALVKGDFMLATTPWLLDYNDAGDILGILKSDHPNNYRAYSNAALDAELAAAATEGDVTKRALMLHRIERNAVSDTAVMPLYWNTSRNLVSPAINGFVDNVRDIHRARWLSKNDRKVSN